MDPSFKEGFERDGYAVFDSGIPAETLDAVVEDMKDGFDRRREAARRETAAHKRTLADRVLRRPPRQPPDVSYADQIRVSDAWMVSPGVRTIARLPSILDLLRDLYGREPRPFQTINFHLGTQQPPHSDAFHFNSDPPGFMCGVWVALEDIDESSGPLVYYPGSHRLPEVSPADLSIRPSEDDYPKYEEHVRAQIERKGLEPRLGLLRKGQALLWASNLVHGGSPASDPHRTRLSQVTHYYFADCDYWTPMLSSEEQIVRRTPQWVT